MGGTPLFSCFCYSTGADLHIHDNCQKGALTEDLFEKALKRISVQAFDALLTCGVRDLEGLLRLTVEDLHQASISSRTIRELIGVQRQFSDQTPKTDRGNNEIGRGDNIGQAIQGEQQEAREKTDCCAPNLHLGTLIANDLSEMPTMSGENALIREKVLALERLLEFHEEDLYSSARIGGVKNFV